MKQREAIHPAGVRAPLLHCSPAIRCGPYVFISGQTATDWVQGRPPSATLPHLGDSTRVEVRQVFKNLKTIAEAAGGTLFDVARVDNYYTNRLVPPGHFAARDEFYSIDPMEKPASTAVMVSRFIPEGCRYAVEALMVLPEAGPRRSLITDRTAPSMARIPLGIQAGDFAFLTGRMATGPEGIAEEARTHPWIWFGSPIKSQTEFILKNHAAILEAGGMTLRDIVKSDVFLLNPHDITGLDEVWREFFPEHPPARCVFVVNDMALRGGVIEINHVAHVPSSRWERRTIETGRAPKPLFYEPQAVRVGPFVFFSTQLAHDGSGLAAAARANPEFPHLGAAGRLEAEVILKNLEAVCAAAGGSLANVVKVQTYLTDLGQLDAVNEVWKRAFPVDPPAWMVLGVDGPLPVAGATMACSAYAVVPEGR